MAFDMLQRAAGIHACSDNKEEFQEYLTPASGSEAIFEQGFSFAEAASSQVSVLRPDINGLLS